MIDLAHFRENVAAYVEAARKKNLKYDVTAFAELDKKFRQLKVEIETLRSQQNTVNKEIPKLTGGDRERKLEEMKALAAKIKDMSAEYKDLETRWEREQLFLPGIPLDKVPAGASDKDNVEIRKWGKIPEFNFVPADHGTLGKALDIIDVDRGVNIAGARSYFLKGDGARLQHAVMQFAIDLISAKGYTVFDCPHIVLYKAMMGTSYFPGGEESAYHLDERDSDCYLIGTSEVAVTSYHENEILDGKTLPRRYAGYSPCYRREAGTYGKDTQGIYRVHQFYKVEQVIVCKADPDESAKMHAEILGNAEEVMQKLELPYRVVDVCAGDMGQGQAYKNDIEAWMPSRKAYGETHSCSTFHDFQARRLKLRYKDENGKNIYCHTLNNTLIASPRVLIPIIENNQQADGTVVIPRVLRPYMGGQEVIRLKK
jgi:seryl-tRNA synthetase